MWMMSATYPAWKNPLVVIDCVLSGIEVPGAPLLAQDSLFKKMPIGTTGEFADVAVVTITWPCPMPGPAPCPLLPES
jgi:hypothetical protein